MAIIILPLFFSTLLLAFTGTGRYGLRQSLVYAATVYTLCLAFATELFSIWDILVFEVLLTFWIGFTLLLVLYLRFYGNRAAVLQTLSGAWTRFRASKALWVVTLIWSFILAIALVYPPNTWDAMVYHMPRVLSWIQQGSIGLFPTAELRQLHQPPLAGWNILHFQILSDGDRFATTVQWLALVGCGIAASLIARELRQPFRVQVLALVIATTLPMGLLQGSSTLSDLVVSFWFLLFALFALQYLRKPTVGRISFCGLALGFALLTKGTAHIFAPPLGLLLWLYGIIYAKGLQPRMRLITAAAMVVGLALLLNSGHWARNWGLFGHPQPPTDPEDFYPAVSVPIVWANLVRHAALHLGVPSDRINAMTLDVIHDLLGDLTDDPGSAYRNQKLSITFSKLELNVGNFLHFWVLLVSLLGVVLLRRRFQFSALTVYLALAIVLGMILYSSILRWDPWASRRHIPLFMLGAPVAAVFVSSLGSRMPGHFTNLFLIMSVPWIFFNETRPIYSDEGRSIFSVDRAEERFYNLDNLSHFYIGAVDYLKEYRPEEIGIQLYHFEYPFRFLMKENSESVPRFEHVGIANVSRTLQDSSYAPQHIISTRKTVSALGGVSYRTVWIAPGVGVWAREELAHDLVSEMFVGDTLVIESNYDVYVRDNALLYVKESCGQEDVDGTFFVQVVPVDINDLPYHRRQYRSDNLDFRFEAHGWRSGDMCLAARRLPTYAISHIETGQYGPGAGHIWEGSFSFDQ